MAENECQWCGDGVTHSGVCPRVSAIQYDPGTGAVVGVAFHEPDLDTADAVLDFLNSIDPGQLNDAACALIGEAGDTFGECAIEALRRMASGHE